MMDEVKWIMLNTIVFLHQTESKMIITMMIISSSIGQYIVIGITNNLIDYFLIKMIEMSRSENLVIVLIYETN